MTNPEISVVIPHYNDPDGLARCLDAVEAQTMSRDRFEIVVADNNSPVGMAAVEAAVAGRARIVSVAEPGAGPARNGGVAVARGAILAFTDSDCLPEPGWLAAGVAALANAGLVGGAMKVLVEDPMRPTPAEAFELVFAFDNRDYVERKHFTVTANLFVRAGDFARVGPFRVGVSEDQEWCLRARAAGLAIVYAPDAVVGHPARRDWPALSKKLRRIVEEQYQLFAEQPGGRLRWIARSLALPASALAHLPRVWRSAHLPDMRARGAAAALLIATRLIRVRYAFGAMRRR